MWLVFVTRFQHLIDTSDALRTVITEENGVPQRVVRDSFSYALPLVDFSAESDLEIAYSNWLNKQIVIPFRISEGLFDSALVKLADDRFVWYFNQHHMMADASSFFCGVSRGGCGV